MLTRFRMTLAPDVPCRGRSEWAYHLYAALLGKVPEPFSRSVHEDGITPLSQYLQPGDGCLEWSVTLLGEKSEDTLRPVLESAESFHLERDRVTLIPVSRTVETVKDADSMLLRGSLHGSLYQMQFRTATAFKSRGQYCSLPSSRLILQSLIRKWNGCFQDCPIEDEDGEGMEAMADGIRFREFRLQNRVYYLKGNSIPGFSGSITAENRLQGFHRDLAGTLLLFADFAGVGIKTTLGMGGVTVQ